MSPRNRFALILGLTIFAVGAVAGFMVARARTWHHRGWAGLSFISGFNSAQQAKMMGLRENSVMMTVAGGPADGRLLYGDEILAIDGIPIKDVGRVRQLDRGVSTGSVVTYSVKRGNRELDVPVRFASPLRSRTVIVTHVVALVVGLTFITIGLIVMLRAPNDTRAVVFYSFALLTAVALIGKAATVYEQSNGRGFLLEPLSVLISVIFFGILSVMYMPLILHLALIFPRPRPLVERRPYVVRWIYAVAATSTMVVLTLVGMTYVTLAEDPKRAEQRLDAILGPAGYALLAFSLAVAIHLLWTARREGVAEAVLNRPFRVSIALLAVIGAFGQIAKSLGLKPVAVVLFLLPMALPFLIALSFPFFAFVALYRSYRGANAEEKRQVAWPLWGLITTVGGKILMVTIAAALGMWITLTHRSLIDWRGPIEVLNTIPTLLTLIIPVSFAVAILKYRLMNIDVIIRKTVVYALLSGFVLAIYLGMVGVLGAILVNYAGVKNQFTVIGATLVVALVFVPMRNKLQTLVERNLFRHKYDYPEAIRAVGAEALMAGDAGALLTSAAEKTQRALQNRAVVMFVRRHEDFVAAAKVGAADSIVGGLRIGHTPAMEALLAEPFDPRRASLPDDTAAALKRVETSLIVPINTPGTQANGFIAVAPRLSGGGFDDEDVDFLREMASQLDIGLDRIRQQREDVDYSQARDIQQGLLPREMPRIAGLDVSGTWQPARTMGGDYYDLITLSDTELAVCIGDVAGKGMPAALLMSGLQAAVRASASSSPRDLCERVRRVVVSSLTGGRFVTFFYATIDTAAMRMRWTNAGHNAPILARGDGSAVRLEEGGPAISRLFRDTKYTEHEIALTPGDRIVLFTDGVSEAGNGVDMFGEQRIEELVAGAGDSTAEELQQRIASAATTFAGGEVEDDLTLVVVRVRRD